MPLFLTRRRDLAPDGTIPTLLYGYGGFQIAVGPTFKPEWLAWMERGGLLAVASLRGGGEYGKSWHDDGRLANKQHVFDDFAACARWLAASGWTSPRADRDQRPVERRSARRREHHPASGAVRCRDRRGRSHGHASVPSVHDRLGMDQRLWLAGRSRPVPDAAGVLAAPQHPSPARAYPATLVTTGDHDDRVVPGHSFKFAAALQAAQAGDAPILIRIDTDAGHGMGKPVTKLIDERADVLAFLDLALAPAASRSRAG